MTFAEFQGFADQLKAFPEPIKLVVFSGMGEPLLNHDLPRMIRYLRENKIAERIEMYSNGSLLTKELIDDLVDSGLTGYKLSVEGLTEEQYWECSKYRMDMEKFLENLRYFYEHRKNCHMYIKIIDSLLPPNGEQTFYDLFGDLCDHIYIEHLSEAQPLKGDINGRVDNRKTMYNEPAKDSLVCQFPFYTLLVDADLNVFPCPTLGNPSSLAIGNAAKEKMVQIWNGAKMKKIRLSMLRGERAKLDVCKDCGTVNCMYHPQDDLDSYAEDLLRIYE